MVVVFCKDYDIKEWCGLEWSAIFGLVKQRRHEEVMLTRFDRVDGKGLFELAGYVDLDVMTPEEVASLVLERLAINEGLPRNHYCALPNSGAPDWPAVAPPLAWPVADHREAQEAFAQLITRAAKLRVLPIHGVSETGKSHLTKQFLRNALAIPDLTCGRFDFKGSADMSVELDLRGATRHPCAHAVGQRLGPTRTDPGVPQGARPSDPPHLRHLRAGRRSRALDQESSAVLHRPRGLVAGDHRWPEDRETARRTLGRTQLRAHRASLTFARGVVGVRAAPQTRFDD